MLLVTTILIFKHPGHQMNQGNNPGRVQGIKQCTSFISLIIYGNLWLIVRFLCAPTDAARVGGSYREYRTGFLPWVIPKDAGIMAGPRLPQTGGKESPQASTVPRGRLHRVKCGLTLNGFPPLNPHPGVSGLSLTLASMLQLVP